MKDGDVLEPGTVVYGSRSERMKSDMGNWEGEQNLRVKHLEYLREIIPKYVVSGLFGRERAERTDLIVCVQSETRSRIDTRLDYCIQQPGINKSWRTAFTLSPHED